MHVEGRVIVVVHGCDAYILMFLVCFIAYCVYGRDKVVSTYNRSAMARQVTWGVDLEWYG